MSHLRAPVEKPSRFVEAPRSADLAAQTDISRCYVAYVYDLRSRLTLAMVLPPGSN